MLAINSKHNQYMAEFSRALRQPTLTGMSMVSHSGALSSHDARRRETPAFAAIVTRMPRRELVARVTTFVRDNLSEPIKIAELSRMAGVSERTLRAAFQSVIGISPKKYALSLRLQAAHQALASAEPGTTTVTDVAMTFGFFELGRFAGKYRECYGALPSETLRHLGSDREQPEQAA